MGICRLIIIVSVIWFAFFYALYILFSRKYLSHVAALPSSFYVQLGAGVVLSLIHFSHHPNRPYQILSEHFQLIISMSILCSLMAMTLFLAGLQKITSSEASILSTTEPISGVIIATTLLGEKIALIQIIGGLLILIGMVIISIKKEPSKNYKNKTLTWLSHIFHLINLNLNVSEDFYE